MSTTKPAAAGAPPYSPRDAAASTGAHVGRQLREALAERLHQDQLAGLARGDREIMHARRIERRARPKQALHASENDVHGRRQLERLGCRHELLPGAHEQLVGEDLTQLGERMADGRSTAPEPFRGAGHAGIDEEGVERHQEIGVDFL